MCFTVWSNCKFIEIATRISGGKLSVKLPQSGAQINWTKFIIEYRKVYTNSFHPNYAQMIEVLGYQMKLSVFTENSPHTKSL